MTYIITTTAKAQQIAPKAQAMAQQLGYPYVSRQKHSLPKLLSEHKAKGALVIGKDLSAWYTSEGKEHRFHLSMAQLRILEMKRGREDHLITAIGKEAKRVLDGTLGLGSDSMVMSYGLDLDYHLGLEQHPLLAYITNEGFRHFEHEDEMVTEALRKIQVANVDYRAFLQGTHMTFDVIYLDPMFTSPIYESPQFKGLRDDLAHSTITREVLDLALEHAPKVVIKERPFSEFFKTYPPHEWVGGTYSSIGYGVYDKHQP